MKQFILLDCTGLSPYGLYCPGFSCNLLSMASYIRENTGWEVKIVIPRMDFGFPLEQDGSIWIEDRVVMALQQEIGKREKTVFGFSITSTDDIVYALPLARKLKETFDAPILYGGFAPTIAHRTICKDYHNVVDAVIVGMGEYVCVELLRKWDGTGIVPNIPGVATIHEGNFVFKPQPTHITRPLPVRLHTDIMDNLNYYRTVIYNTSFGCRFRCQFCIERYMNFSCWSKPLDRIRTELNTLLQKMKDPLYVLISDALFDFRNNRAIGITQICKELGATYFFESHVDTTPFNILPGISGTCNAICYGLENGSPDILSRINKTKIPDKYLKRFKKLFRTTTNNDITAIMSVMLDYPGTRRIDIEESEQFLEELFEDYYKRFKQGEGPHYLINIPRFRYPCNDFLEDGEIQEFNETSVTWKPWFKNSYRGFPVREKLLRIVNNPSDDIGGDEIKEVTRQIYEKAGMQNLDFMKFLEARFPVINHRLWLGGDYIKPCLDDENPHVISMKKLVNLI